MIQRYIPWVEKKEFHDDEYVEMKYDNDGEYVKLSDIVEMLDGMKKDLKQARDEGIGVYDRAFYTNNAIDDAISKLTGKEE